MTRELGPDDPASISIEIFPHRIKGDQSEEQIAHESLTATL